MKWRLLDSWPYVLALVAGFALVNFWPAKWMPEDPGYGALVIYVVDPLALLVGAMVLAFRRGYDWVTLLVCAPLYCLLAMSLYPTVGFDFDPGDSRWLQQFVFMFIPATQVGMGLGLLIRTLYQRRTAGAASGRPWA